MSPLTGSWRRKTPNGTPFAWLAAANATVDLYLAIRGPHEADALLERVDDVATGVGDDYHLAVARITAPVEKPPVGLLSTLAEHGDRYLSLTRPALPCYCVAECDPAAPRRSLLDHGAHRLAAANRRLREERTVVANAMAARSTGDLRRCIGL